MQKIRWFFWILLISLVLVVALQNNNPTRFQLLLYNRTLSLSLLMLSATAIGFLFGSLMTVSMLRSRHRAAKASQKPDPDPPVDPPADEIDPQEGA